MGSSLINIGISGLKAHQAALSTTGHNITNASTPGYSRQIVDIQPHPPQYTGSAYIGRGATLESVKRVANDFATNQVRLDTSAFGGLDTFVNQIGQVDSLFADDQTGLAPAMQTFFGALQSASSDPSSIPTRQVVLSDAAGLASRFNTMYDRLNTQQQALDQQLGTTTDDINQLALGIGRLNDRIAGADGRSSGVLPNDLLDQREELLRQLAEKIDVKVVTQGDGQISVFIGKGQPLISGGQVATLHAIGNGRIALSSSKDAPGQIVTGSITGGQLGGLLNFRNGVLDAALNQLGRIAMGLSSAINQQQHKGVTLSGEFGDDLFTDINKPAAMLQRAVALNTAPGYPSGTLAVAIDSPAQLSTSDYEIRFDRVGNGAFTLVRLNDGQVVGEGSVGQGLPTTVSADGFTVTIESGQFHGGDRYLIEPTRSGARDITQLIGNAADLAFSSPVRADSSYGNQGTGAIDPGAVLDAASPSFAVRGALTPPLLIHFTSETMYEVLDNSDPSAPKALQPPLRNLPYVPGIENSLLPGVLGQTRVASNGGSIQKLVGGTTAVLGLVAGSNGYLAQQISVANTDANGFTQGTQVLNVAADSSARAIAASLSAMTGVSASAKTTVSITGIHDNGGGVPLALVINGQRFQGADLASLNALADAIGRDSTLVGAGITARSNGTRLELTAATGDNLDLHVSGDAADGIDLAGPTGDTLTVNGAGAGTQAQLVGSIDRSAGFDFSSGGPFTFDLTVDGGPTQTLTMTGTYATGPALVTALQNAIDASSIGAGRALVGIDGGGHLQFASLASGANGSIAIAGAPTGSPIATALGISNAAASGEDLYRTATVGGSVSVLLDAARRLTTDSTTINNGIFTAAPPAVRADFGYQLTMTGRPRSGDSFAIGFNDGAVSDNANVLAMADVQSQKLFGKDGSLFDAYANIVESIGARTGQARIDRDASNGLLQQSVAQRDSIAGVNLDEEAANLIRFEQAYNASARVIAVARDTFDTLFRMMG
jgi:flagellar hook-associated protein 1 FlgK